MPRYHCKAVNLYGERWNGIIEASSEAAAIDRLKQRSYYPLRIRALPENKDFRELDLFTRIPVKELAVFCEQFSAILRAGVTLVHALYILSRQTEHRLLRITLEKLCYEVQTGKSLSESMSQFGRRFPPLLISMIEMGETSGTLDASLAQMSKQFEKETEIRRKIQGALIYPMVVCLVSVAVIWVMLTRIVPTYTLIFEQNHADLPEATRVLLAVSRFMVGHGWELLLGMAGSILLFCLLTSKGKGRLMLHQLQLRLPLWGKLTMKTISSRFARNMSTMLSAGIPLSKALSITARLVRNDVISKGLETVEMEVKEGKYLSDAIERLHLFPPMISHMIRIGEESGSMEEMLEKTAVYYEAEVESTANRVTILLEPFMILILGGIVGFILMAIALPMFEVIRFAG